MEAVTNIYGMIATNNIYVPDYQRAYSWDTQTSKNLALQVNVFLDDLNNYILTNASTRYYFGHFLFEKKENNIFAIIDGQQRLTTIIIFLSVLFRRLKDLELFNGDDEEKYQNVIKRPNRYPFSTVQYDNQFFYDYVIDNKRNDKNNLDTVSKKRIINAYDYLWKKVKNLSEREVRKYLDTILDASCTTHIVDNESQAIQMFIFQNNRGKQPTLLEIIKAQFLYNIHISPIDNDIKLLIIEEIRNRFEEIYRNISKIENKVSEDDVLLYTLKIHFNSLWEDKPKEKIEPELKNNENDKIDFIKNFTLNLSKCFESLTTFFEKEKNDLDIHSLFISGQNSVLFPFIIKAILNGLDDDNLKRLSNALESIFIRARVIGTRADLRSRLNDVFQVFDIDKIIERIDWMKKQNGWYGYWNNESFRSSLQGYINPATAKILLWKYENHLIQTQGNEGYGLIRYDSIDDPQLEHIAPKTENPSQGYDRYTDKFINECLECLGNYLLLSGSHNMSIGNIPFIDKLNTYTMLKQQKEIVDMTMDDKRWTNDKIIERKNRIIRFITSNF